MRRSGWHRSSLSGEPGRRLRESVAILTHLFVLTPQPDQPIALGGVSTSTFGRAADRPWLPSSGSTVYSVRTLALGHPDHGPTPTSSTICGKTPPRRNAAHRRSGNAAADRAGHNIALIIGQDHEHVRRTPCDTMVGRHNGWDLHQKLIMTPEAGAEGGKYSPSTVVAARACRAPIDWLRLTRGGANEYIARQRKRISPNHLLAQILDGLSRTPPKVQYPSRTAPYDTSGGKTPIAG